MLIARADNNSSGRAESESEKHIALGVSESGIGGLTVLRDPAKGWGYKVKGRVEGREPLHAYHLLELLVKFTLAIYACAKDEFAWIKGRGVHMIGEAQTRAKSVSTEEERCCSRTNMAASRLLLI